MNKNTNYEKSNLQEDQKVCSNAICVLVPETIEIDEAHLIKILESTGDIVVLDKLKIEVGYEISTGWEDGRLHGDPADMRMLELKITTPAGDESSVLTINLKEFYNIVANDTPYFKSVNPFGANAGRYVITVTALSRRVALTIPTAGKVFIYSLTPRVRMFVDDNTDPSVDVSYPPDFGDGGQTTQSESTGKWFVQYTV